jgi:hypothetical protein
VPRLAFQLLEQLPAIDAQRRRIYLSAFTDAQCSSWGGRTRAAAVVGEADRFVGSLNETLQKPVMGYSQHRLAWLCQLITELDDAVEQDQEGSKSDDRAERSGLYRRADLARRQLAAGLMAAAHGNKDFAREVTDRNDESKSAHALETTVTGLLQLAARLRRSDDGELIADDVGLTAPFLSSVSSLLDSLRAANQRTFGNETGGDSKDTNLVEGRVLREMNFAFQALKRAREFGATLKLPPVGPHLASLTKRAASDADEEDEVPVDAAPRPPPPPEDALMPPPMPDDIPPDAAPTPR